MFDAAASWLRLQGYHVFNPADHDHAEHGDVFKSETGDLADIKHTGFDIRSSLHADTTFICCLADAVVTLDGYLGSKGALAEVKLAEALGLPVIPFADFIYPAPLPVDPHDEANGEWGEVRAVSSTGGEKAVKLARYDLIPAKPLRSLAEHFGRGARKYEDNNWRRGYEWSKSFAALNRHLWQWWDGEDIDAETGSSHLVAVAWHAFALLEYSETHKEFDDRPKGLIGA
jgi:hypothetical protein